MRGLRQGAIVTAVLLLVGAGAARACEGRKVLFEDQFSELQSTWDASPATVHVEDGQMIVRPKATFTVWVPNTAALYDDIDMCVDVTTVDAVDPTTNSAGLVFWYVDNKNFYRFEADASGNAAVFRESRGKTLKQIDWTKVAALHLGDGATNQLRVVTKGKVATFYVNGKKFRDLNGQPPGGGQEIGVIGTSPKKGVATYAFANFKITQPD